MSLRPRVFVQMLFPNWIQNRDLLIANVACSGKLNAICSDVSFLLANATLSRIRWVQLQNPCYGNKSRLDWVLVALISRIWTHQLSDGCAELHSSMRRLSRMRKMQIRWESELFSSRLWLKGLVNFVQSWKIRIFLVLTRLYRNFVAASAETTA